MVSSHPHRLHLELHEELDGKENMVELDFLGKDSIRYYNRVQVERQVFKNLNLFMKDKVTGDDLFDRLTVSGVVYDGYKNCQESEDFCLTLRCISNNDNI